MSKLTLDIDALDVQSFEPVPREASARGSVRSHEYTFDCTGHQPMCPSMYNEATTCQVSDLGTCVASCGNTCPYTCNGGASCVTCAGPQCEEDS